MCIRATEYGNAGAGRVKEELQPGDTCLAAATPLLAPGTSSLERGASHPLPSPQRPQPLAVPGRLGGFNRGSSLPLLQEKKSSLT